MGKKSYSTAKKQVPPTATYQKIFWSSLRTWILAVFSIIFAAVGAALLRVRPVLTGTDIQTLMFYAWNAGDEGLAGYALVRTTAAACLPYTILGGGILLYGWSVYASRRYALSLHIQIGTWSLTMPRVQRRFKRPFKHCWPLFVLPAVFFCCVLCLILYTVQLPQYLTIRSNAVPIYREEYTDTSTVEFTFPQEKRNLVHIVIESMETTFEDTANGGAWEQNHIPYLTLLAEENISFSDMYQASGAGYTTGALVAQSAGIPLTTNQGGATKTQNITTLHDVLATAGYQQLFLCGSNAWFGARANYFAHHSTSIWDYNAAVREGKIPKNYMESSENTWGFEDIKLYEYAKEQIVEMAQNDAPFSITLLTVDTHAFTYYTCEQCPDTYPTDYENIYRCADSQLYAFLQWLQSQDFYEDTAIIITGDHLSMDGQYFQEQNIDNDLRRIYNCFINPPQNLPIPNRNRALTSFDIFPTTLRLLNITWKGTRLGLGVDLFSDEQTLVEKLGEPLLNSSLQAYQQELIEILPNPDH